eukprot:TRINITY_DN3320_c0_g1_i1.p1 TRINITY_DN3320_c0_g1~~TRINITY_DN3320_c0_g1_i1.p1  ORF type:complete len:652 (-),score=126.12 TRINITY_DN3320_c0_g1_i1:170-2125(-)
MAVCDSEGFFHLFGTDCNSRMQGVPKEQFFSTDYYPLHRDANNWVIDEMSQLPPHKMPRPLLCTKNGSPYQQQPPDFHGDIDNVAVDVEEYERERERLLALQRLREASYHGIVLFSDPEEEIAQSEESNDDNHSEFHSPSGDDDDDDHDPSKTSRFFSDTDKIQTRQSTRKKKRSDSDSSDYLDGENAEVSVRASTRRRRKRRRLNSSVTDQTDVLDKLKSRRRLMPLKKWPDWLTVCSPKYEKNRNYIPQLGDLVMYMRQGNVEYLQEFPILAEVYPHYPWESVRDMPAEQLCRVTKLRYLPAPVGPLGQTSIFAEIGLTLTKKIGEHYRDGKTFLVQYHPSSIVDFLVLKSRYERNIKREWKVGDKVRMFYLLSDEYKAETDVRDEGRWYTGTIATKSPVDARAFPDSPWDCLEILWDEELSVSRASPWEIEYVKSGAADSDDDDNDSLSSLSPSSSSSGEEKIHLAGVLGSGEVHALLETLEDICADGDVAAPFLEPVSLQDYSDYSSKVFYPMDLGTLKKRVAKGFYRHKDSLLFDISKIADNSSVFNGSNTPITQAAEKISAELSAIAKGVGWGERGAPADDSLAILKTKKKRGRNPKKFSCGQRNWFLKSNERKVNCPQQMGLLSIMKMMAAVLIIKILRLKESG